MNKLEELSEEIVIRTKKDTKYGTVTVRTSTPVIKLDKAIELFEEMEAKLAESEKDRLMWQAMYKSADRQNKEICETDIYPLQEEIAELKQQLAEKETELSLARNEINTLKHNLNVSQEHDNIMCKQYFKKCKETNQDKISFAVKQLKKVKKDIVELIVWELTYEDVLGIIDNQIKAIKDGK